MFRTRLSDRETHASIMPFDNLFTNKSQFEELCKRTKNVMEEVIVTMEPLKPEKNNIDTIQEKDVNH